MTQLSIILNLLNKNQSVYQSRKQYNDYYEGEIAQCSSFVIYLNKLFLFLEEGKNQKFK